MVFVGINNGLWENPSRHCGRSTTATIYKTYKFFVTSIIACNTFDGVVLSADTGYISEESGLHSGVGKITRLTVEDRPIAYVAMAGDEDAINRLSKALQRVITKIKEPVIEHGPSEFPEIIRNYINRIIKNIGNNIKNDVEIAMIYGFKFKGSTIYRNAIGFRVYKHSEEWEVELEGTSISEGPRRMCIFAGSVKRQLGDLYTLLEGESFLSNLLYSIKFIGFLQFLVANFGSSTKYFEVAYITDKGETSMYPANHPAIRNMVNYYRQLYDLIKKEILNTPLDLKL